MEKKKGSSMEGWKVGWWLARWWAGCCRCLVTVAASRSRIRMRIRLCRHLSDVQWAAAASASPQMPLLHCIALAGSVRFRSSVFWCAASKLLWNAHHTYTETLSSAHTYMHTGKADCMQDLLAVAIISAWITFDTHELPFMRNWNYNLCTAL